MPLHDAEEPGAPGWWLLRLGLKLKHRRKRLDVWQAYHDGDAPLPVPPKGTREAFTRFQELARSNLTEVITASSVNRLKMIGITDANGDPDETTWRWFVENKIRARQKQVYRLSMRQAHAYVSVGEHPKKLGQPLILPEHPHSVITEQDPATREVAAGLKAWVDDWTGFGRAVIQTPEGINRYQTVKKVGAGNLPWGADSWEPYGIDARPAEEPNPYRRVMIVPFTRMPDLGVEPVAEHACVLDIQDRINMGVLSRISAERYAAWRQKYVTGHKYQARKNPDGSPMVDPVSGLEMRVNPFVPGPDTVWASEGDSVKFGEFAATDSAGFIRSHESDILDMFTISHTPPTTRMSQLVNIATDTVALLDANHLAKVGDHAMNYSDSWEDVRICAALVAKEEEATEERREIRWQDPRTLNPSVLADAAVKMHTIGYPLGVLAENMGESPERIKRITGGAAGDELMRAAMAGFGAQVGQPEPVPAAPAEPQQLTLPVGPGE